MVLFLYHPGGIPRGVWYTTSRAKYTVILLSFTLFITLYLVYEEGRGSPCSRGVLFVPDAGSVAWRSIRRESLAEDPPGGERGLFPSPVSIWVLMYIPGLSCGVTRA